MAFYQLKKQQFIKASLNEIWEFISAPQNLSKITPESMGFNITSEVPEKMYEGLIISYTVKPLLGIKTTWVTEITHIENKKYFVDEQRVGPYKMWHHEHILEEKDDGVLMTDIVSYQPPFAFLGAIANRLIIKKKLAQIFSYREKVLNKMFQS